MLVQKFNSLMSMSLYKSAGHLIVVITKKYLRILRLQVFKAASNRSQKNENKFDNVAKINTDQLCIKRNKLFKTKPYDIFAAVLGKPGKFHELR